MNESERYIQTAHGKIYYWYSAGRLEYPTIVFLHGLSANHLTWRPVIKELTAAGYNCLVPDLRGHGHSDKTKTPSFYRLQQFSEDLQQIIENEKLSRSFLVGYSFGGSIAFDYASQWTDTLAGIVLISANHRDPLIYHRLGWFAPIFRVGLSALAFMLLWQKRAVYRYYQPDSAAGYWHSVWAGLQTMPLSVNLWLMRETARLDLAAEIKRVNVPTLLIHSARDPFLTKREISEITQSIPGATVITAEHAGHFIASQAPTELLDILFNFLGKHAHRNI